jgi:hypothetical protein
VRAKATSRTAATLSERVTSSSATSVGNLGHQL